MRNEEKAKLIYDAIDNSNGFYVGHAEPESRSLMNITFTLQSAELEKKLFSPGKEAGFVGLAATVQLVDAVHLRTMLFQLKRVKRSVNL